MRYMGLMCLNVSRWRCVGTGLARALGTLAIALLPVGALAQQAPPPPTPASARVLASLQAEKPLRLMESFYFVFEFNGDYYVQLGNEPDLIPDEIDEQAVGPQGKHWNPETGASAGTWDQEPLASPQELKVLSARNPYAIGVPFAQTTSFSAPNAKGWTSHWEVYDGGTLVCSGGISDFQVVGIVIPHFGEIEGWREDAAKSPQQNLEVRQELFDRSAQHLMAKMTGCKKADATGNKPHRYWARPTHALKPSVTDLVSHTPDDVSAALAKQAQSATAWPTLVAAVQKAYVGHPDQKAIPSETRVHYGVLLKEGKAWLEVAAAKLGFGDSMCGAGPASAFLTQLYVRSVGSEWKLAFQRLLGPDDAVIGAEVLLFGDFNGDGKFEAVVRTEPYSDKQILLQIEPDGSFSEIKLTFLKYFDCPC